MKRARERGDDSIKGRKERGGKSDRVRKRGRERII